MALAGVAFASCSNHDDWFDAEKYAAEKHEAKVQEYTQAFIREFGTPAPGHTWGFGTGTRAVATRSADPSGSSWYKEGYTNIPPADTKEMEDEITALFTSGNWKNYKVKEPIHFEDFFVQQVHKGDVKTCNYDSYKDNNGTRHKVYGPDHMDQLVCQKKDGTKEHIYNFNNAEFNKGKYDQKVVKGTMTYNDCIMLMTSSGTEAFGWSNSEDGGAYYMESYVVIEYPEASGYYYVGFDYNRKDDGIISDIYQSKLNDVKNKQDDFDRNSSGWDENQKKNALAEIARLQAEADKYKDCYKNGDKFVDPNGYYDDWIVRITPAKVTPTTTPDDPVKEDLFQVWCEDLGGEYVTDNGNDFDFNDVVLRFVKVGNDTEIWLDAAGGTLPVKVSWDGNDYDVHEKLNAKVTEMVNTGYVKREPVRLQTVFGQILTPEDLKNRLKIKVQDKTTEFWYDLNNKNNAAPQMIICEPGLTWPTERQKISDAYKDSFDYWVNNEPTAKFSGKKKSN